MRRIAFAVAASLLTPGPAFAATATVEDGVLTVAGTPGQHESVYVRTLDDADYYGVGASPPPIAGPGCTDAPSEYAQPELHCTKHGVERILVTLGDGNDSASADAPVRVTINGAEGNDFITPPPEGFAVGGEGDDAIRLVGVENSELRGGPGTDTLIPDEVGYPNFHGWRIGLITESLATNDGTPWGAPIREFENVRGTMWRDRVVGDDGPNALTGGDEVDTLAGRGGDDRIDSTDDSPIPEKGGIHHLNEQPDSVSCGDGFDRLVADRADRWGYRCERVRVLSARGGIVYVQLTGGPAADRLIAPRRGPSRIRARGGPDWVAGGPQRDRVLAGRGDDLVDVANDGGRDSVICGHGDDIAVADGRDRAARDCERIIRR